MEMSGMAGNRGLDIDGGLETSHAPGYVSFCFLVYSYSILLLMTIQGLSTPSNGNDAKG